MKKMPGSALAAFTAWKTAPLVFLIIFPVLIVRVKFVFVAPEATALWPWPYFGDTRSWWKAVSVIGAAAWMVAQLVFLLLSGWRPLFRRLGLLAGLAAALTLASALFSPFPKTAWLGSTNLYEGALVLFSYLLAVWYAAETTESGGTQWMLVRLIGCVGMLEALHGIFEGMGINFWMTPAGHWLMGGGGQTAAFTFADTNMAYGTVFQPNHYGMLMAMVTMLALGMVRAERHRKWTVFWILLVVLGLAAVVYSNSRTAMVACGIVIAAFISASAIAAVRRKGTPVRFGKGAFAFAVLPLALVLFFIGMAAGRLEAGPFGERVRRVTDRLLATFVRDHVYYLEAAALRNDAIALTTADGSAELVRDGKGDWSFGWTGNGDREKLRFSRTGGGYEAVLPWLREGKMFLADNGGVRVDVDGSTLWYYVLNGNLFAVDHKGCLYAETAPAGVVRFGGLEKYLGGRGQTWGLGLALVPQHPWLGTGPGSFGLVFPNHEILIKQRYLESLDEDKGHGIWLTFLVQLGVAGTLSYVFLVAWVLLRKPWKASPLGVPLVMGVAAYILGAVTNDSTVGVTPIFCVLLGLIVRRGESPPTPKSGDGKTRGPMPAPVQQAALPVGRLPGMTTPLSYLSPV